MLHNFEYAWSITVREMLALQSQREFFKFTVETQVFISLIFTSQALGLISTLIISSDFACLFLEKTFFVREAFLQRESGWEQMQMHSAEKTHAECRKQRRGFCLLLVRTAGRCGRRGTVL